MAAAVSNGAAGRRAGGVPRWRRGPRCVVRTRMTSAHRPADNGICDVTTDRAQTPSGRRTYGPRTASACPLPRPARRRVLHRPASTRENSCSDGRHIAAVPNRRRAYDYLSLPPSRTPTARRRNPVRWEETLYLDGFRVLVLTRVFLSFSKKRILMLHPTKTFLIIWTFRITWKLLLRKSITAITTKTVNTNPEILWTKSILSLNSPRASLVFHYTNVVRRSIWNKVHMLLHEIT